VARRSNAEGPHDDGARGPGLLKLL